MDEYISASALKAPRDGMTDLTATFAIHIPVKLKGFKHPVRQSARTSLRIPGRDRAELDDK